MKNLYNFSVVRNVEAVEGWNLPNHTEYWNPYAVPGKVFRCVSAAAVDCTETYQDGKETKEA